ncbi:type II secretion system protein, partial [bacterium]|nr:type II secretion system protein [bacterium]
MFHQRYLNKNKGMTLIETIVSMWILGIVIVS